MLCGGLEAGQFWRKWWEVSWALLCCCGAPASLLLWWAVHGRSCSHKVKVAPLGAWWLHTHWSTRGDRLWGHSIRQDGCGCTAGAFCAALMRLLVCCCGGLSDVNHWWAVPEHSCKQDVEGALSGRQCTDRMYLLIWQTRRGCLATSSSFAGLGATPHAAVLPLCCLPCRVWALC